MGGPPGEQDKGKGKGKDGKQTLSQGYGKEQGGKAGGKGGGKKGWSPNGFQGECYNCGEKGHSAKWCNKGKGGADGRVSWMGAWPPEWSTDQAGSEESSGTVPMFAKWLKPKKI